MAIGMGVCPCSCWQQPRARCCRRPAPGWWASTACSACSCSPSRHTCFFRPDRPRAASTLGGAAHRAGDVSARARSAAARWSRADDRRALLRRFSQYGPPGIIFFGVQGTKLPGLILPAPGAVPGHIAAPQPTLNTARSQIHCCYPAAPGLRKAGLLAEPRLRAVSASAR